MGVNVGLVDSEPLGAHCENAMLPPEKTYTQRTTARRYNFFIELILCQRELSDYKFSLKNTIVKKHYGLYFNMKALIEVINNVIN